MDDGSAAQPDEASNAEAISFTFSALTATRQVAMEEAAVEALIAEDQALIAEGEGGGDGGAAAADEAPPTSIQ